jgi:hypothetical protein
MLSDRLQVYLRAHLVHIAYEFSTPVMAAYEDDDPLPNGDHEWPLSQLAREVEPGQVPPSVIAPTVP